MPNLEELFQTSTHPTVVAGRMATEGKTEVNTFDVTTQFQDNFNARNPGDRNVVLGANSQDNNGGFTPLALNYYPVDAIRYQRPSSFKPDTNFKEWTPSKRYMDVNSTRPGIVYRW